VSAADRQPTPVPRCGGRRGLGGRSGSYQAARSRSPRRQSHRVGPKYGLSQSPTKRVSQTEHDGSDASRHPAGLAVVRTSDQVIRFGVGAQAVTNRLAASRCSGERGGRDAPRPPRNPSPLPPHPLLIWASQGVGQDTRTDCAVLIRPIIRCRQGGCRSRRHGRREVCGSAESR
jgi:hypothetical protein